MRTSIVRASASNERVRSSERSAGLTVGRSGRLYVALSGAGRVVVLQPDGTTTATLPTDPASTYDTPVRVTFSPAGLMVVEQAPTRPAAGRVIELGVDDAGRPR